MFRENFLLFIGYCRLAFFLLVEFLLMLGISWFFDTFTGHIFPYFIAAYGATKEWLYHLAPLYIALYMMVPQNRLRNYVIKETVEEYFHRKWFRWKLVTVVSWLIFLPFHIRTQIRIWSIPEYFTFEVIFATLLLSLWAGQLCGMMLPFTATRFLALMGVFGRKWKL